MSRSILIKTVKEKISTLYFLSPEIEGGILNNIDAFPEDALNTIINTLDDAKKKQEDIIAKLNSKNRDFNEEFKRFLDKNYKDATDKATEEEHQEADKLADKLLNE